MPIDPQRIQAIFLAAAEIADPAERAQFLDNACDGNAELRSRVEKLLEAHDQPDSFLDLLPADSLDPGPTTTQKTGEKPSFEFLETSRRPDSLGRIGHYEVLKVLGQGGFGIVFQAFDDVLRRIVAVKVLAPSYAASGPARARFLREARNVAAVRDDHVVGVHAVSEDEAPAPYLVMEFVSGQSLQQKLEKAGPLPPKEALRIGMQVARGLAAAHAQGLIHRDIKPANILLENGVERVKITDFGLARTADDASLSQSGVAGTPMYMSPEQARGDSLDTRSDLFSLGSMLYTLLAGRPPFRAETTFAVLKRVTEDEPRPLREANPEVPHQLADLVAKLHAKTPADRYQTATEVADLLGEYLAEYQQQGEVAPRPSPPPRRRTGRMAVIMALAAGLALIGWRLWPTPSGHSGETTFDPPPPPPLPWKPLFNGTDLTGWTPTPNQPNYWKVENGELIGNNKSGGVSSLLTTRHDYANFHLRARCQVGDKMFGQIMVRCAYDPAVDYVNGYYVLAKPSLSGTLNYHENNDNKRAFHQLALALPGNDEPDEWFTLEVIAQGNRITTFVNGRQASAYEDAQRRASQGHIGLEVWDHRHTIRFKSIEVRELPAGDPTSSDSLLESQRRAVAWLYQIGGKLSFLGGPAGWATDPEQAMTLPFTVHTINFYGVKTLNDASLNRLRDCPPATHEMLMEFSAINDAGLARLASFPCAQSVRMFNLSHTRVSATGLVSVAKLPKLKVLLLSDCENVDGSALKVIAEQSRLEEIFLGGCKNLDDVDFKHLAESKTLTGIGLDHTRVSSTGLAPLAKMPKLRNLVLTRCENMDGRALRTLADFPRLEFLDLERCPKIGDDDLAGLAENKSIRNISLGFTQVSAAGLKHLAKLPNLRDLSLAGCDHADSAALKLLAEEFQLENIRLDDCSKTGDIDIAWLAASKTIRHLNLSGTGITDAGLESLARCKGLTWVMLFHTKVTRAGLERLAKSLPKCKIEWDDGVIVPK